MRSIKLTENGDIDISNGRITEVSDSELTLQRIKNDFKFYKGEWYLNRELGVPYFEVFFGKNTDKNRVQDEVVRVLDEIPAILEILEINIRDEGITRFIDIKVRDRTNTILDTTINVDMS